jgi:hypothetical protein
VIEITDTIEDTLSDTELSGGTSEITGEQLPSGAQQASIRKRNLLRAFAERRKMLADALTVNEVAHLLGTSRQTPHDRYADGKLVAVKENGRLLFPLWQFDPEAADGVIAGLPEVLSELGDRLSPLGIVRWFITPKMQLAGRTPVEVLGVGDVQDVIDEAKSLGAS